MKRLIVLYLSLLSTLLGFAQSTWVELYGSTGLWKKIDKTSKKIVLKKDTIDGGFILYDGSKSIDKIGYGFYHHRSESTNASLKKGKLFFGNVPIGCDSITMKDLKSNINRHFSHISHASHYSSAK